LSNTEGVWLFGGGGDDTLWAAGSTRRVARSR